MREPKPKVKRPDRNRRRPKLAFKIQSSESLLSLKPPFNLPLNQPVQQQPIQPQAGSLLDDLIKLAAEIGWAVFKVKWAQDSPDSRKAWDVGAKLATSPSLTPIGQNIGVGLCFASLLVGLDDMDGASDN